MPGVGDAKFRGRWTTAEDELLMQLVAEHGNKNWRFIATHLPGRLAKQCRERWFNQLDPSVRRESLSEAEWRLLLEAHSKYGNHWAEIVKSGMIPGRTANQLKNHWNTRVRRRMTDSGRSRRMRAAMAAVGKANAASALLSEAGPIVEDGEEDGEEGSDSEEPASSPVTSVGRYPTRGKSPLPSALNSLSGSAPHGTKLTNVTGIGLGSLKDLESLTEAAVQQSRSDLPDQLGAHFPLPSTGPNPLFAPFDLTHPLGWQAQQALASHIHMASLGNNALNSPAAAIARQQYLLLQQQQQQQQQQFQALIRSGLSHQEIQQHLQYQQQMLQLQQQHQLFGSGLLGMGSSSLLPSPSPLLFPHALPSLPSSSNSHLPFANNSNPSSSLPIASSSDPSNLLPSINIIPTPSLPPSHNSTTPSASTEAGNDTPSLGKSDFDTPPNDSRAPSQPPIPSEPTHITTNVPTNDTDVESKM